MIRRILIAVGALISLSLAYPTAAAAPKANAERCKAAEALIRSAALGSATALGESAHNLRGARDETIFASWPGGPPPREILVTLNDEHPLSVLECSNVERAAREKGLTIKRDEAGVRSSQVSTAYASLPAISSDGKSAASVVTISSRGHGVMRVVTLTKQSGGWKIAGQLLVAVS